MEVNIFHKDGTLIKENEKVPLNLQIEILTLIRGKADYQKMTKEESA